MKRMVKKHSAAVIAMILLLLLLALVLWTIWGNKTVGTTCYSITSNRLPDSFDGFKIAVVSDLHNAKFGSENSRITQKMGSTIRNPIKIYWLMKSIMVSISLPGRITAPFTGINTKLSASAPMRYRYIPLAMSMSINAY